jgi:amino acid permease
VIGIASIILYGLYKFGGETWQQPFSSAAVPDASLTFWPDDMVDMTMFVGVATFCFGLCSMAFPIEESMRNKEDFSKAVFYSLIFVWVVYTVIGEIGAILYVHDVEGIKDNILRNLPEEEYASSIVRISMALVRRKFKITCGAN